MAVNQLESNLEAISRTLSYLEKEGIDDRDTLDKLKEERDKILKDLKVF